ncbi:MAG: hypothetical protein ACU84Q_13760 [Gammaproteobacteria bacterium]
MSHANKPLTNNPPDRRIEIRLPVRRLNVQIAGTVLSTADISAKGARIHCSIEQFPLIKPQLSGQIDIAIELPIGREVAAIAKVSHVQQALSDVYIGLSFESFRYRDEAGWLAFIASEFKEFGQIQPSLQARIA